MSGKSYGAIQVTNANAADADEDGLGNIVGNIHNDNTNTNTTNKDNGETVPLLSSNNSNVDNKDAQSKSSTIKSLLQKYWSHITFDWISPLLHIGNTNGQLNVDDLETMPLPKDCTTEEVYAVFLKCWEEELNKAKESNELAKNNKKTNVVGSTGENNGVVNNGSVDNTLEEQDETNGDEEEDLFMDTTTIYNPNTYQPSLIRALYRAFGADFLRAGLLKLVHDSNLFVGPQVLNRLIQFMRNKDAPLSQGLGLMLIVTGAQIVMSFCVSEQKIYYIVYQTFVFFKMDPIDSHSKPPVLFLLTHI